MEKSNGGRRRNKNLMNRAALAVASGKSIGQWARDTETPPRTVYGWSQTAEFKELVVKYRERSVDLAIGVLTKNATVAVREIARLVKNGENGSVRLNAAKSIIGLLIEVSNHAEAGRQLAELKARIASLEGSTDAKRDQ